MTRTEAPQINATIDRLVMRGLDPASRTAFVDGLRSELSRVLADPVTRASMSGSNSRTPVLRLGQVPLQPGISGARTLGHTVARAIGRSGNVRAAGKGVRP